MKNGFTLLELLATIAIMAVLIAAVLPFVSDYTSWAKRTQANRSALLVADAINRYNALQVVGSGAVISASNWTTQLLGHGASPVIIDGIKSKFLAKQPSTDVTVTFDAGLTSGVVKVTSATKDASF
jgi:prepilin-type N-terminal cleavage/methylation domain-containing protein